MTHTNLTIPRKTVKPINDARYRCKGYYAMLPLSGHCFFGDCDSQSSRSISDIVITFFITVTTNSGPVEFGARKPLVRLYCGVRDEYRRIVAGHAVADVLYRPNGSISGWTEGRGNKQTRKVEDEVPAEYHCCGISEGGSVKSHVSSRLETQMGMARADGCHYSGRI
jgi:hypothetical protein